MPIHEFECPDCGWKETAWLDTKRREWHNSIPCAGCGGEAKRIISLPAVHFAPGQGFTKATTDTEKEDS